MADLPAPVRPAMPMDETDFVRQGLSAFERCQQERDHYKEQYTQLRDTYNGLVAEYRSLKAHFRAREAEAKAYRDLHAQTVNSLTNVHAIIKEHLDRALTVPMVAVPNGLGRKAEPTDGQEGQG